jgi:hypothetical protein
MTISAHGFFYPLFGATKIEIRAEPFEPNFYWKLLKCGFI